MGAKAMETSPMANKGSKDDVESTAAAPSGLAAEPDAPAGVTDRERAPPRERPDRQERRREPLHAFIVHFDAEPSSKPLPPDRPDRQA